MCANSVGALMQKGCGDVGGIGGEEEQGEEEHSRAEAALPVCVSGFVASQGAPTGGKEQRQWG